MSINRIIYTAADGSMGECTHEDCNKYRAWALEQITAKYPNASVEVSEIEMIFDEIDCTSAKEEDEVADFLKSLWDACPWTGEHFD